MPAGEQVAVPAPVLDFGTVSVLAGAVPAAAEQLVPVGGGWRVNVSILLCCVGC